MRVEGKDEAMMDSTKQYRLPKEKIAVFCFSMLVMLAVFGIMFAHRYSTDGYSDYYLCENGQNAAWKIQLGRLAGGAAEAAIHLFGINPVAVQLPFTLLFIAAIAWCCTDLWSMIISAFSDPDDVTNALVLLAIYPAFINISFGELFFFSNCAIHWTGMLVTGQLALHSLFSGDKLRFRLLAVVLMIISLEFYQAELGYFVIWGILIALLRGRLNADTKTVKSLIDVLIISGIAAFFSVFSMKLLEFLNVVSGSERSPGISSLLENAVFLLTTGQRMVFVDGLHFMGKMLGLVIVCLTVGIIVTVLSNSSCRRSAWLIFFSALVAYWVSFVLHLLSPAIWMAPRTIFSVFSYLSFCSLIILFCVRNTPNQKKAYTALAFVLGVFLCVSGSGVFTIGLEQIRNNAIDKIEALSIVEQIHDYELRTGKTVSKIGLYRDSQTTWSNSDSPNAYMDINLRSGAVEWECMAIISYFNGLHLEAVTTPQDVVAHFSDCEWDKFVPEEQIAFVDDTLYLAIY